MSAKQHADILAHMQAGRSITAAMARARFGCMSMKGCAESLRQAGHVIHEAPFRADGRRYMRYWMTPPKRQSFVTSGLSHSSSEAKRAVVSLRAEPWAEVSS